MKTPTKQPVETVVEKGQSIPIYHAPVTVKGRQYDSFMFAYIQNGSRKRARASTLEKARAEAKNIARQLGEGTGHAHSLTPSEVSDFTAATKILRTVPGTTLASVCQQFVEAAGILGDTGTLAAAARHYRAHLDAVKLPSVSVAQVIEELLAAREAAGSSKAYVDQLNKLVGRVKDTFRCPIGNVASTDLQSFIDKINLSPRSKENYRRTVRTIWNFAKRRGYLPRDRSTEADHIDTIKIRGGDIGIYQPAELQAAIGKAKGIAQLTLAIGAFAGLRTAEIHRLEWQDIGKQFITVQAEKAKTGARRIVPILPALASVLRLHKAGQGRISQFQNETHLSRSISECFRAAEIEPVKNGLRHSFCTYRIAETQNTAQVALEAGNSPTILFQHYRELATKKQAAAWFAVRPAGQPKNVLEMSAEAA